MSRRGDGANPVCLEIQRRRDAARFKTARARLIDATNLKPPLASASGLHVRRRCANLPAFAATHDFAGRLRSTLRVDCSSLREQLAGGDIDLAFAPLGNRTGDLTAEPLWSDQLVTLVGPNNPLPDSMSLEAYAAAEHLVDAGHVQVSADGVGTSVVDAILSARGLRRRIVLVLPSSVGIPFVVAETDLIATLPSRIVKGLCPVPNIRILNPPLPGVQVSPQMFWHRRTDADPLQIWLRAAIRDIAAGNLIV